MNRRTRRWVLAVVVGCLALLACLAAGVFWIRAFLEPDLIDEYLVSRGRIELRVRAGREGGLGQNAPGGIYHYETRSAATAPWQSITVFRYSEPNSIPRGQIRFVNDSCVYFFHEFVFGVSTDGGLSWTIRGEPEKSLNTLHQWAFPRIESVSINEDGTGVMRVSPYRWQTLASTELTTDDFGKTWK